MHDFLRAVGFKNIKDQKELDELLQSIVSSPTTICQREIRKETSTQNSQKNLRIPWEL